jgi:hypothetical protein
MALINKTGISNGSTIEAEHITRAIDALSGGSTDSVSITGSLMGSSSYAVTASYALNAGGANSFPFTGSARITGSLSITGSLRVSGTNVTSSFIGGLCTISSNTISLSAANLLIDTSVGSMSGEIYGNKNLILDLSQLGASSGGGYFAIPLTQPSSAGLGAMYIDDSGSPVVLKISDGSGGWYEITASYQP